MPTKHCAPRSPTCSTLKSPPDFCNIWVTGDSFNTFLPPHPGDLGTIAGQSFDGEVDDSETTGFIHCIIGSCALAGYALTVPDPSTPTGPHPWTVNMPAWIFTGSGGVGLAGASWDALSAHAFITESLFTNVSQTLYVGHEISRVPEPVSTAMFLPGIALLGLLGCLRLRRR